MHIDPAPLIFSTYDHRVWKIGLPVRSAVLKPHAGRLVVGWVTTSESLLFFHTQRLSQVNGETAVIVLVPSLAQR
ncbi:hypothetical protein ASPTUDRAFT_353439 [Aspergillus tubingensis CBS 134.48]|uniref:Uncharacterized protein n=1 Tax=Aspergillus tubingensis (strain CBS 134.48) TaxID=767770 RepID=A0A1L9NHS7_ASPTC|nr:hypothetical protein ASPTUDRAFT_353439 [Aspergillus tubingensis CBS 134.48]